MSQKRISENVKLHKQLTITKLNNYIDGLISNDISKANKFCYWLGDYVKFLNYEAEFNAKKLKRYKRGDVIKAHLGFNIGSEEGGLHYCIVLDKNNDLSSPIVTVIPLTSVKNDNRIRHLRKDEVFLGNELFSALQNKINENITTMSALLHKINAQMIYGEETECSLEYLKCGLDSINNMKDELSKMKKGSIALIGQITTISKIRIYTPKNKYDTLSKVRCSNESLDKIDKKIHELFIKK